MNESEEDQKEETCDSSNRVCPYCGNECQVEAEDYDDNQREETCSACGKKYYARDEFQVTHYAKPDCELNGELHNWEDRKTCAGPYSFCSKCDQIKPLPPPRNPPQPRQLTH